MAAAAPNDLSVRILSYAVTSDKSLTVSVAATSTAPISHVDLRVFTWQGTLENVTRVAGSGSPRFAGDLRYGLQALPAGVELQFHVTAEDSAGNVGTSERKRLWYTDSRYEWRTITEGTISVHYYGSGGSGAATVLKGARAAEQRSGRLLGVTAPPFNVLLFNAPGDAVPPVSRRGSNDEIRSWASWDHGLVHVIDDPENATLEDTARHEVTHMLVLGAVGPKVDVPLWLNEGLAVWSEQDSQGQFARWERSELRSGELPPLRDLDRFPVQRSAEFRAYVQAWSVVNYLIDSYGETKLRELFRDLKDGQEQALRRTYGLGVNELDAAWRWKRGLRMPSPEFTRPTPLPVFSDRPAATSQASEFPGQGMLDDPEWGLLALMAAALCGVMVSVRRRRSKARRPDDTPAPRETHRWPDG